LQNGDKLVGDGLNASPVAPKSSVSMDMTKAELLNYAEENHIPVRPSMNKTQIIETIEAAL
jgi:hypothetical protein